MPAPHVSPALRADGKAMLRALRFALTLLAGHANNKGRLRVPQQELQGAVVIHCCLFDVKSLVVGAEAQVQHFGDPA